MVILHAIGGVVEIYVSAVVSGAFMYPKSRYTPKACSCKFSPRTESHQAEVGLGAAGHHPIVLAYFVAGSNLFVPLQPEPLDRTKPEALR